MHNRVESTLGTIPFTHAVDVPRALETLDHAHMVALSELFLNWALSGAVSGPQSTNVLLWSIDYEAIASFAGDRWRATSPDESPDIVRFIAEHARAAGIAGSVPNT